mgnify:FL=1
MSAEEVNGLCHLVAYAAEKREGGKFVGVAVSEKVWHYGIVMSERTVLDNKGKWDSEEAFVEASENRWGEDFDKVYPEIREEEVEIFSSEERRKARNFAKQLL